MSSPEQKRDPFPENPRLTKEAQQISLDRKYSVPSEFINQLIADLINTLTNGVGLSAEDTAFIRIRISELRSRLIIFINEKPMRIGHKENAYTQQDKNFLEETIAFLERIGFAQVTQRREELNDIPNEYFVAST